jgi:hypothetical protein
MGTGILGCALAGVNAWERQGGEAGSIAFAATADQRDSGGNQHYRHDDTTYGKGIQNHHNLRLINQTSIILWNAYQYFNRIRKDPL